MSFEEAKKRIMNRVDLPSLVGEDVELRNRGGHYSGRCPFHDERSPSFAVYTDHYYCYGCQAQGDAIKYVREMKGLGFTEALKFLAEKYGVEAPELEKPSFDKNAQLAEAALYKICAETAEFFRSNLEKPSAEKAREYVESRGFSPEFANEYGFGLAIQEPLALVNHLLKKGRAISDMITASVALASKYDQKGYDFFINRLMIPIADMHGRVIAFGGRSFGDEQPKYKNSMNTPLFDKSQVLYNLHRAKDSIRTQRSAIICEGYMDVLQLANHGVANSVACLGTALTLPHLRRLAALTPQVNLVFDGDKAGRNATLRTVSTALEVSSVECRVVVLPQGEDPDTFVRTHGADAFREYVQKAKGLLDFAIETRIQETHALGVPDLVTKEIVPWLQTIKDPLKQGFLTNRISELTGIAAGSISQAVKGEAAPKKTPPKMAPLPNVPPERPRVTELKGPELELFGHLYWSGPEEFDIEQIEHMFVSQLELEDVWLDFAKELLRTIRKGLKPNEQNKAYWTSAATPEVLDFILGIEKAKQAYETEFRQRQFEKLVRTIRKRQLDETVAKLKQRLLAVEGTEETEILMAISGIKKELLQLDNAAKKPLENVQH